MSHYFERIINKEIDTYSEIEKIENIFFNEKEFLSTLGEYASVSELIDKTCFRKLKISANFLHLRELFDFLVEQKPEEEYVLIEFFELVLSLIIQFAERPAIHQKDVPFVNRKFSEIDKIITYDLEKLGLEKKKIDSNLGKIAIIIPHDEKIERAISLVNKNNRDYLIEYLSKKTERNTRRKEELLKLLANDVENITKNKSLRAQNERLFEDTDFLFNNLDLRHGVEVNDKCFYDATLNDREKWLDITFNEVINVFIAKDEAKIHSEILALRKAKKQ